MILGKEIGNIDGYKYIIYQDSPTTFHYSVSHNDMVYYDYKENPASAEELKDCVTKLVQELDNKVKELYLLTETTSEVTSNEESS